MPAGIEAARLTRCAIRPGSALAPQEPVLIERRQAPDLGQPRTVAEVLGTALKLYLSYPAVFLGLAVMVVVPYELAVLLITNSGPLGQSKASVDTVLLLDLIAFALVGPLVSALQVRAVLMIGEHEQPRLLEVVRRSLTVLPVVVAAEIIAGIGIGIGLVLLVVPGVILALRWAVVAQVAAIEQTDWPGALRRSGQLTTRHWLHILAILLCVALVNLTLTNIGASVIGTGTKAPAVIVGLVIAVLVSSFQALATAVLYFDLRARESAKAV